MEHVNLKLKSLLEANLPPNKAEAALIKVLQSHVKQTRQSEQPGEEFIGGFASHVLRSAGYRPVYRQEATKGRKRLASVLDNSALNAAYWHTFVFRVDGGVEVDELCAAHDKGLPVRHRRSTYFVPLAQEESLIEAEDEERELTRKFRADCNDSMARARLFQVLMRKHQHLGNLGLELLKDFEDYIANMLINVSQHANHNWGDDISAMVHVVNNHFGHHRDRQFRDTGENAAGLRDSIVRLGDNWNTRLRALHLIQEHTVERGVYSSPSWPHYVRNLSFWRDSHGYLLLEIFIRPLHVFRDLTSVNDHNDILSHLISNPEAIEMVFVSPYAKNGFEPNWPPV